MTQELLQRIDHQLNEVIVDTPEGIAFEEFIASINSNAIFLAREMAKKLSESDEQELLRVALDNTRSEQLPPHRLFEGLLRYAASAKQGNPAIAIDQISVQQIIEFAGGALNKALLAESQSISANRVKAR